MTVTVNLSGEGIEFEREVSESTALSIMELSITNGSSEGTSGSTPAESTEHESSEQELPDNFFTRLSSKQEAMLTVLAEADEPLSSTELRRRMSEDYDVETSGGRALAGILAGFTRKYGEEFHLVTINWGDGEGMYQLNPERPGYIEEIEARLLD